MGEVWCNKNVEMVGMRKNLIVENLIEDNDFFIVDIILEITKEVAKKNVLGLQNDGSN